MQGWRRIRDVDLDHKWNKGKKMKRWFWSVLFIVWTRKARLNPTFRDTYWLEGIRTRIKAFKMVKIIKTWEKWNNGTTCRAETTELYKSHILWATDVKDSVMEIETGNRRMKMQQIKLKSEEEVLLVNGVKTTSDSRRKKPEKIHWFGDL